MKPISEEQETHIVRTLDAARGFMDAHKHGNYVQGIYTPISSYNTMLRLKKSEDEMVQRLAEHCSEIFFNYGHGRDDRIAMMAHAGEWPETFTARVQSAIDAFEEQYKAGEVKSRRDDFFAARARRLKRDGFETWRGMSE